MKSEAHLRGGDGSSAETIKHERQVITGLEKSFVNIQIATWRANRGNTIEAEKAIGTIAEWLIWRKGILTSREDFDWSGELAKQAELVKAILEELDGRLSPRSIVAPIPFSASRIKLGFGHE